MIAPVTSGVAALTLVAAALRTRYPTFTIGEPADLTGTATLQIATDLASLDGGAVDWSISNLMAGDDGTRMSVDTPAQGALSMYTITPPGGSAIVFSALTGETLQSLLNRLATRISFGVDTTTWTARREGTELHITSTGTTPVASLWTIVAEHGGSPPVNRINFGVAVETQVAGVTVTGYDDTLTVNPDGQLSVVSSQANIYTQPTVPTANLVAGDTWINTSTDILFAGQGVAELAGTVVARIVPNGDCARGLRQITTGGNTFVGLDIFEYFQGSGLATGVLSAGTYILISQDGIPSTRMFSFGGNRLTVQVTGTDSVNHGIEDAIDIRGIGNVIGSGVVTNPADVATAIGLDLRNTYNSFLVQVSARTHTQSQPSVYTPTQFRVYAKGLHRRNEANNGWISEVSGYEQLD